MIYSKLWVDFSLYVTQLTKINYLPFTDVLITPANTLIWAMLPVLMVMRAAFNEFEFIWNKVEQLKVHFIFNVIWCLMTAYARLNTASPYPNYEHNPLILTLAKSFNLLSSSSAVRLPNELISRESHGACSLTDAWAFSIIPIVNWSPTAVRYSICSSVLNASNSSWVGNVAWVRRAYS